MGEDVNVSKVALSVSVLGLLEQLPVDSMERCDVDIGEAPHDVVDDLRRETGKRRLFAATHTCVETQFMNVRENVLWK